MNINFIDEDGEVLQLQAVANMETSHLFDRYSDQKGAPFLLSQVMYDFTYNGELIPLNVTVGSLGIIGFANASVTSQLKYQAEQISIIESFPTFQHMLTITHIALSIKK